jgi:hypothetical protein
MHQNNLSLSSQNFVVEVPTNQTHLHKKQEAINFIYGDYIFFNFCYVDTENFFSFSSSKKKVS